MAEEAKKYYWLKLQKDFFSSVRLKKLRGIAGGDTYTIIYLKMQLKAVDTNGVLTYKHYFETFEEELALDIDEEVDNVRITLNFLKQCGLIEEGETENEYVLPYVIENTGNETASALRSKKYRENMTIEQKESEKERARLAMQESRLRKKELEENVTNALRTGYERVTNVEKELEKEKEKELELEKELEKKENINYQLIADMYNNTCVSFPSCTKLSEKRKKAIKARLNTYSIDDLQKAFEKMEASSFLKGDNNSDWTANFDWCLKDANLAKILDGNYDNRETSNYTKVNNVGQFNTMTKQQQQMQGWKELTAKYAAMEELNEVEQPVDIWAVK